jgi:hypothetical protein
MVKSIDPQLVAFLICDQVIQDARSGKKSFISVFDVIWANKVPCVHPQLAIVAVLTGCHGEQNINLEITFDDKDGEKDILKINGLLKSEDPLGMVDLIFELRNIKFENYGKYTLRLIAGDSGKTIGYRPLRIMPMDAMKGGK